MRPFEKLGLGTVQFGTDYGIANKNGQVKREEIAKILKYCKQIGIDVLDTASAYGNAEQVLGEFDLSEYKVISKFLPNGDIIEFDNQLNNTLKNLSLNTIYGYLTHRPESIINNHWQWEALLKAKSIGKVQKIGFSLNTPLELSALLDSNMIPDLVQVPYNYLDRRFEEHLKSLKKLKVEIHTRSVFLQGLFFMNPDELSNHFSSAIPFFKSLANIKQLSGHLLEFVLSKDFIDKVIIGTESLNQLQGNIEELLNLHIEELPHPPNLSESILMPMFWPSSKQ